MLNRALVCTEEVAYTKIKQRILDGSLAPGARLVHRALAKELEMSPNPVVLALRMLERDGLIVNTPGLGACVRQWSRREIEDLYHMRVHQEALASRLCAERAGHDEMNRIAAANELFKETIAKKDVEENIRADVGIHMAIVAGAHSPDLERVVESLAIMQCSMKAFGLSLGVPRDLSRQVRDVHDPLVKAIIARDPKLAERLAREHVRMSLKKNLPWIKEVVEAFGTGTNG